MIRVTTAEEFWEAYEAGEDIWIAGIEALNVANENGIRVSTTLAEGTLR